MNAIARAAARVEPPRYCIPAPVLLLFRDSGGLPRPADDSAVVAAPADPELASDWCQIHERLVALGRDRSAQERELCRWLRAAERLGVHARTGHASLHEYAERVVGLRGRQLEERLRVARALDGLPTLDQAFATGALCWSAVRELTRIATAATEEAWLRWAKGRRLRQVELAVAGRKEGERPQDRANPALVKHRLRFEVRPETMAMFRDLQARLRVELGGQLDDDTLLYELARRALGGPDDQGRASYQVAVSRCPDCARTTIDSGGQIHVVGDAVADMMGCDCQEIGDVDAEETDQESSASPHVGAAGSPLDTGPHVGVEPRPTGTGAHVGGSPSSVPRPRATQTIPPAIRRAVMRRDGMRCAAPGCQSHRFLDVHHLVPRSEGGTHDPEGLAVLCGLCRARHNAAPITAPCTSARWSSVAARERA